MRRSSVAVAVPAALILGASALLWLLLSAAGGGAARASTPALPLPQPTLSHYHLISTSETPPSQAQCNSVGRRCFNPQSVRSAYNVNPLYAAGDDGSGQTIAIIDSQGSDTIAHDLHVYDQAWDLPPMCGEEGVTCASGMPTFKQLQIQGSPPTSEHPAQSKSAGQQNHTVWALEVSLDVEVAHAMAPGANILLVTTPNAETLGVQGFPTMMNAEQYVIDHHLANVITQSFGAAEESFAGTQSLLNLRHAFISAEQNGVTVLASSGDDGSAGLLKPPVRAQPTSKAGGTLLPNPAVGWPASDPLVTGVGGTYLCTNAEAAQTDPRTIDSASPPANCGNNPGQAEVGWIDAGGGFSHVFNRPDYQNTLPAGSTVIPAGQRGVPDIAFQASSRTGALVYLSLPPDGNSGLICGSAPCSTGWYDIGGTSLASPQVAGLVAIADQINHGGLGLINPALYKIGADPARYANDFFDVTTGNNGAFAGQGVPGFPATTGWDPVTGLGTPNAAKFVPDLVNAVNGH
jgi:subtilase family serine protease